MYKRQQIRNALLGEGGIDVACGECIACCSSSYFIHITPDEAATLEHIPKDVVCPAPGMPKGNRLMGYDKEGRCPMLAQGKCTIYAYRPNTCRTYDCRVFAAAGISAGDEDKAMINQRVARWRFSYPTASDRQEHLAVQAAAAFIRDHGACFPGGRVPTNPGQLAILAIKVYDIFIEKDGTLSGNSSHQEIANAIVDASRKFDTQ